MKFTNIGPGTAVIKQRFERVTARNPAALAVRPDPEPAELMRTLEAFGDRAYGEPETVATLKPGRSVELDLHACANQLIFEEALS